MSPDEHMSLSKIQSRLRTFNQDRDWGQYHSPRNLAMALSVEASELLELYLWSADNGPQPPVESRTKKVADEAADVLICLLNFCDKAGIDLIRATQNKIAINEQKYPVEKVKGRLEKHSEYPNG
ncbi:MAG: nucleotide pyrophosphohydrolase [Myxococcota bacterium]|nr:nucleotide pyrophosphohydrolase [Myxococcota bacterium]